MKFINQINKYAIYNNSVNHFLETIKKYLWNSKLNLSRSFLEIFKIISSIKMQNHKIFSYFNF